MPRTPWKWVRIQKINKLRNNVAVSRYYAALPSGIVSVKSDSHNHFLHTGSHCSYSDHKTVLTLNTWPLPCLPVWLVWGLLLHSNRTGRYSSTTLCYGTGRKFNSLKKNKPLVFLVKTLLKMEIKFQIFKLSVCRS